MMFLFQDSLDVIPEADMTVWFSGKEMQRGKLLSDSVGRNEKTKVIVKIQKVREFVVFIMKKKFNMI